MKSLVTCRSWAQRKCFGILHEKLHIFFQTCRETVSYIVVLVVKG